jgi:hypothetical protein
MTQAQEVLKDLLPAESGKQGFVTTTDSPNKRIEDRLKSNMLYFGNSSAKTSGKLTTEDTFRTTTGTC